MVRVDIIRIKYYLFELIPVTLHLYNSIWTRFPIKAAETNFDAIVIRISKCVQVDVNSSNLILFFQANRFQVLH